MFNLNGIDTYTIIIIFAIDTYALTVPSNLNVGTVLFTSKDLSKKRWSRDNVELLQARRHFESIIPMPYMNAVSGNYIDNLLAYFNNTFSTVKREATDPILAYAMDKALADVVGGYLKVWVLPITKFTYYGGTISKDDAIKVFKYYDTLKRYLNTDGSGWRKPSDIILNSITITVVPFSHEPHTRSMKNPCQHLAYYENTTTGLTIPMPYINWNQSPHFMFLPLKNESLVQLDSPNSTDAILKYYDIAESCCHEKNPDGCNNFDLRFQDWLSNNVMSHMADDNLYIAFGSLLSLIQKSNEFIKRTSNLCEDYYDNSQSTVNSLLARLPSWMTCNKCLILMIILIIEIVWCVPAICYFICSRRQRKMKKRTKFFLDVFRRRKGNRCHTIGRTDNSKERNTYTQQKKMMRNCESGMTQNGINLYRKPRKRDLEADTQCPSNTSRHSIGQMTSEFSDIINYDHNCQCESVTLINEKRSQDTIHSPRIQKSLLPICKEIKDEIHTASHKDVHVLETTITKIVRNKSETDNKSYDISSSSNKTIIKIGSEVKQKLQEISDKEKHNEICPCTQCIEQDRKDEKLRKIGKLKHANSMKDKDISQRFHRLRNATDPTNKTKVPKPQPKVNVPKVSVRANVPKYNVTKGLVAKNINLNKSKGLKLNSGEPLIEIRIDKPPAEITLDVFKTSHKNTKPSKIPRLAAISNAKEEKIIHEIEKVSICQNEADKTVKRQATDDLNVRTKTPVKQSKMNVTL